MVGGKEIALICIIVFIAAFLIRFILFRIRGNECGKAVRPVSDIKQVALAFHMKKGGTIIVLGIACLCYIGIISKIAPYQTDRYFFCIYPLLSMIAVCLLFALGKYLIKNKRIIQISIAAVVLLVTIMSYTHETVNYLYTGFSKRMDILSEYTNYPVIIVNLATFNGAPDQFMYEYEQFNNVYRCSCGDWESLSQAEETKDLGGGFVIYAISSNLLDEEFMENVSQYIDISDWELLTDTGTHVYFCKSN